jgi:hypothetical protein
VVPPPSGPTFEVRVDERALSDDLAHASDAGRTAIESTVRHLQADGIPSAWLKRCDAEARDGTRLPRCVKLYIPQPAGQWGAVFLGGVVEGRPKLFLLAVGERHPGAPWKPSVYEIAHRRLHRQTLDDAD